MQTAAGLFPAAALRGDLGVALTGARFLGPEMLGMAAIAPLLTVRGAKWGRGRRGRREKWRGRGVKWGRGGG